MEARVDPKEIDFIEATGDPLIVVTKAARDTITREVLGATSLLDELILRARDVIMTKNLIELENVCVLTKEVIEGARGQILSYTALSKSDPSLVKAIQEAISQLDRKKQEVLQAINPPKKHRAQSLRPSSVPTQASGGAPQPSAVPTPTSTTHRLLSDLDGQRSTDEEFMLTQEEERWFNGDVDTLELVPPKRESKKNGDEREEKEEREEKKVSKGF